MAEDWSQKTTQRIFWGLVLFHCLFWSLAPVWFIPNYRIDTGEMMIAGQNFVLCNHKHPAMPSWIVGLLGKILHHAPCVPYLAAQAATLLSVWVIWRMGKRFLSNRLALVAGAATLLYYFFNYESTQYNNHTFLITFWLLSCWFFLRAMEKNHWYDWFLTGLCITGGLYNKLTMFLLVFTILFYMFLDSDARRRWRSPGPYITTLVSIILFLPLLIWIVRDNFHVLSYAHNSLDKKVWNLWGFVTSPVMFLLYQIILTLPIIIPLLPLIGLRWHIRRNHLWETPADRFLTYILFFPLALQIGICAYSGSDMRLPLGCHLWGFLTIFLLHSLKITDTERTCKCSLKITVTGMLFIMMFSAIILQITPALTGRASREHFPGYSLAMEAQKRWDKHYNAPLCYVRGEDFSAGCVSIYAKSHPKFWCSTWDSCDEFTRKGGLLIWQKIDTSSSSRPVLNWAFINDFYYDPQSQDPSSWLKQFPNAVRLPDFTLPMNTRYPVPPVTFGMALVPPEGIISSDASKSE